MGALRCRGPSCVHLFIDDCGAPSIPRTTANIRTVRHHDGSALSSGAVALLSSLLALSSLLWLSTTVRAVYWLNLVDGRLHRAGDSGRGAPGPRRWGGASVDPRRRPRGQGAGSPPSRTTTGTTWTTGLPSCAEVPPCDRAARLVRSGTAPAPVGSLRP